MWELDYKESWVPKNWSFCTVVLEKTLESPLNCKIKPVHPKGNQSWISFKRLMMKLKPILRAPDAKNWLLGKVPDDGNDWRQEEKGMTEDDMVAWHPHLDGHGFEQSLGVGDGQESLACCNLWGWSQTRLLKWTDLNLTEIYRITKVPNWSLNFCYILLYFSKQILCQSVFANWDVYHEY